MLEVEGLRVTYGGIEAARGINLRVAEGELVCLIGSNGAGKTTTLRAISGVVPLTSGRIRFQGQEITAWPADRIVARGLAQCPEGRQVFARLSVAENLRMGAILRRDEAQVRRDMDWILSLFPVLGQRLRQPAGTLSGGEQQMLAIGRALMSGPRLLLMDEPSLGLAPRVMERIFQVILDLKQQGRTILLVEQNARKALQIADRGYVMENGAITLSGSAAELRHNPDVERAYLGGVSV